jgi:nicotinate phosphoribosyltransferase
MKTRLKDEEGFIINSLLQTDFYEFPMGQFILKNLVGTRVTMEFINRTEVPLARYIPEEDLRRELNHVMELRFGHSEIHYLRGTNEYQDRMFDEMYLIFLKGLKLPQYELKYHGDNFRLSFTGPFETVSYWEEIALQIVNELYYRALMKQLSRFARDLVYAEGQKRLARKIEILRQNPDVVFSDFGTRRTFSAPWHDYVVGVLKEELPPEQFRGTSNVHLAVKHELMPMGTNAHKLQMVLAGLAKDDGALACVPFEFLRAWYGEYDEGLSIILSDTFGSENIMRNISREELIRWKGFRHDSGDAKKFGDRIIQLYEDHNIDPKQRMIIFSDGLDLRVMLELQAYFYGRIKISFGWGTNLTNDLGFKAVSIVIKPTFANGVALVKLSDNLAKAMGPGREVQRYKRVFGYTNRSRVKTTY